MQAEDSIHCLFCKSPEIRKAAFPRPTHFNSKRFDYYECETCGLIFIDPLPSGDDYGKMYAKDYHEEFYFHETAPDYSGFYNLLEKYGNERSVVDYGCGDGSFLNYFSEKGYKCTGVEYDRELVGVLKEKFPAIGFYTVGDFNKLNKEIRFGAIYLGDVLEHLDNPAEFIKAIGGRLSPGGLIMVQGPLENNFTLALLFRKYVSKLRSGKMATHIPYHISFSNARNQKMVFEKNGFDTVFYNIYETSWPLPRMFSFRPVRGLQWLVARVSIFFSKILPAKFGNRFIYVGKIQVSGMNQK